MAEKEEKKTGLGWGGYVLVVGGVVGLITTSIGQAYSNNPEKVFQYGHPKYDKAGKTIVGCEIILNPGTHIYTSYDAALFKNNPHDMSCPDAQRIVKTAYYSTSNGYEYVGMDEYNYQQHEQEIIDNGGRLVVVLTVQVDNQNEPEGFFNAGDLKTKEPKIYGPIKN